MSSNVCSSDRRPSFIVVSMACRTARPIAESNTTAMIGQIQICRFSSRAVRETVRPDAGVSPGHVGRGVAAAAGRFAETREEIHGCRVS